MPLGRSTSHEYEYGRPRRPAGVWIALAVGALGVLAVLLGVLGPITGLVGAAAGAGIGVGVHVPVAGITVAVIIGCLVAIALVVAITRVRHRLPAWVLAILAILVALAAALYPLIAVGLAAANGAGDLVSTITGLVQRFWR